jgi:flagellar biosynthesis protein
MAEKYRKIPGKDEVPTTKAVAVERSSSDDSPKVVASGQGFVAEQILQIAFDNDIKVREDADLVEILSAVEVDSEVPLEAFAAIAEILTYVYQANNAEEKDEPNT